MHSLIFYKPPTGFAVVKTDSQNDYKIATLANAKLLQAFYTHCGGQNGLFEHVQISYTTCGGQNGLFELLYIILQTCSINALSNFYKPPRQILLSKLLQASDRACGGELQTFTSLLHAFRWSKHTKLLKAFYNAIRW